MRRPAGWLDQRFVASLPGWLGAVLLSCLPGIALQMHAISSSGPNMPSFWGAMPLPTESTQDSTISYVVTYRLFAWRHTDDFLSSQSLRKTLRGLSFSCPSRERQKKIQRRSSSSRLQRYHAVAASRSTSRRPFTASARPLLTVLRRT